MKLPRWAHKVYANFIGYFWLPCPICEEMFGGHESHGALMENPHVGWTTCGDCSDEATRRNLLKFGRESVNA